MSKAGKARKQKRSTPPETWWRRWFSPILVGILALTLFLMTLAPTVTAEDSGELIAAAWHFGIPHPPGYPLWTILCGIFVHIIHAGSVAFRANLFSAVCSSAAAAVAYAAIREMRVSKPVAAAAALIWIWSRWSWSQSVITEVYALNSLLTAGILWCGLRWSNVGRNRLLIVASLLLGLGMSNHHTIGLVGLAVALWILLLRLRLIFDWKLVLVCTGMFLVGLLPYSYLYIRAADEPAINWGDPSTPRRFWEHVSRHHYGAFGPQKVHEPRSLPRLMRQLHYFGASIVDDLTPWLTGAAIVGMYPMIRRQRRLLLLVLLWLASAGVLFVVMANYDSDVASQWATRVFFIPVTLGLVIPIASGLQSAIDFMRRKLEHQRRLAGLMIAGLVIAGPGLQAASHWHQCNYSNYWYAYDHGRNLLKCMLPNALVFPSGDHDTFTLTYLILVERLRNDVLIGDIYGYLGPDSAAALIKRSRRPVYYTTKTSPPVPNTSFVPAGALYHLLPSGQPFNNRGLLRNCTYRNWDQPTVLDSGARYILCEYEFFAALHELENESIEPALDHFRKAAAIRKGVKQLHNNIGSALAEHGLSEEAIGYFQKAARLDDYYTVPRWNLFRLFKQLGREEDARRQLEKIIQVTPKDFRPYRELGFLLNGKLEDQEGAIHYWRKSLRLKPEQPDLISILERQPDS